jgi:hypothetical protein
MQRLAGALVAGVAVKLAEVGVTVDPATLITIAVAVYGAVHKGVEKVTTK